MHTYTNTYKKKSSLLSSAANPELLQVKNHLILFWYLQDSNALSKLFEKVEFCDVNISYKSSIILLFYCLSKSTYSIGVGFLQYDTFVWMCWLFDLFSYWQHFKEKKLKIMREVTNSEVKSELDRLLKA